MSFSKRGVFVWMGVCLVILASASAGEAQFGDLLKKLKQATGGGLTEEKIVEGLKEALQIGTTKAVERVSRPDGYYANPRIRIPLPGAVKKVEKPLRLMGYGHKIDEFERSMNRAAEKAAPQAKAIFLDAIKKMTFKDARKILEGEKNEATLYFKRNTRDRLHEIFKPVVHDTMADVGVTRAYQEIDQKISSMPMSESIRFDLDDYVTNGALEGLFYMLAKEEEKIRKKPAARVTDLLKEVFGSVEKR
jgi:hypothetical protein